MAEGTATRGPANPFAPPLASLEGGTVAPPFEQGDLATRGSRLAAVLLDALLALPALLIFLVARGASAAAPGARLSGAALAATSIMSLYFIALLVYQCYLLSTRGQTLGKKWLGVKIVKLDGTPAGFPAAVALRVLVNSLIGLVPIVGGIYVLVDSLMIFRDDRRCIHDLIAGTRVVKA